MMHMTATNPLHQNTRKLKNLAKNIHSIKVNNYIRCPDEAKKSNTCCKLLVSVNTISKLYGILFLYIVVLSIQRRCSSAIILAIRFMPTLHKFLQAQFSIIYVIVFLCRKLSAHTMMMRLNCGQVSGYPVAKHLHVNSGDYFCVDCKAFERAYDCVTAWIPALRR